MNDVLYVTTFNKDMFEKTGKLLLASYVKSHSCGDFLICREDNIEEGIQEITKDCTHKIEIYDIMQYPFFVNWINCNSDIIPKQFGGRFICRCRRNKHNSKCANSFFLKKASKWFRKTSSIHFAINNFKQYKYIIFIDSDVVFKKQIRLDDWNRIFDNHDMFYMYGPYRKKKNIGFETGIVGWQSEKALPFLNELFQIFENGQFRTFARWDEAWLMDKVYNIIAPDSIKAKDIVDNKSHDSHVLKNSELKDYFIHNKGLHWRNNINT